LGVSEIQKKNFIILLSGEFRLSTCQTTDTAIIYSNITQQHKKEKEIKEKTTIEYWLTTHSLSSI